MKRHFRLLVLTLAAFTLPLGARAQDMGMSALFTSAQSETTTTVPAEKGWASDAGSSAETKSDVSSDSPKAEGASAASGDNESAVGTGKNERSGRKQKDGKRKVAAKSDDDSDKKADTSDAKKSKAEKKTAKKPKGQSSDAAADAKSSNAESKDKKADDSSGKKADGDKDSKAEPKVKKASKKSDVPWPTRLTSFACCSFLGMPIAMAKSGYKQTLAGNRDLIGESKNPIKLMISTSLSIPFAAVGGFLEGSGYSVINSWKGSADEPFGREAFSLEMAKPVAPDAPPQEKQ